MGNPLVPRFDSSGSSSSSTGFSSTATNHNHSSSAFERHPATMGTSAFRFKPNDLELIKQYLLPKVLGVQLPSDAVIEGEVYDARLPDYCEASPLISRSWIEVYRQTLQMTPYLPLGFRFNPFHLELAKYYLLQKALRGQLPSDAVIEGEVYGDDAQLPEAGDIGDRELYVFVKIKRNQNGTKTKRRTRNGYWKVTGNKKKIEDESGNHIGTMRSLVFMEKRNSEGEKKLIMDERKKNLLMDEYTLDGSLKKMNSKVWVLCKIKQSNRSPERPNSQEEEEEEGDCLTSRQTASPALQGIDNISNSLVIDDMECFDMDDIWASIEDNQAMAECPFEPAGGPVISGQINPLINHGQ